MKAFICLIFTSLTAFAGQAQGNQPVSWKFASEATAPLTYKVYFVASIRAPFHIYPQSFSGGIGMPTTISIEDNSNVELLGEMEEKGVGSSEGEAPAFYAKGVTFSQVIRLRSDEKTTLRFRIRYMACNDQMCLPPSSKEYTLDINDGDAGTRVEKKEGEAGGTPEKAVLKYEHFDMPDVTGKKVSTASITAANKYTFIDFWASWCVPCRAQGRALVPLYKKYRDQGFGVIGVSLDTDVMPWKKAIVADGYDWTNLSDLRGFDSPIIKKIGINGIPRNILVNDKGVIVGMDLHGKELETKLAELFK